MSITNPSCMLVISSSHSHGGGDREDPWQGSTPKRSSVELPSQGASPDVLPVSEVGDTHACTRLSLYFLTSYQVRGHCQ